MNLDGKTALVTGGSGFIGGRAIEVLVGQYGMNVRTLVRATTSAGGGAFRAAAAGAEIHFGSLLDPEALAEAVKGCDLVVHCAYGTSGTPAEQREVTVEGTRRLAEAAAAAGVKQFVHLSTVATFGGDTPPMVDESFVNPNLWDWPYAHDKLDAEGALSEAAKAGGMPYTILRLGAVYGPYGTAYTVIPLNTLATQRIALVDDGQGVSSATYVDDVVQAVVRAAVHPGEGETFMIRGPDRVTWRQFYEYYDRMSGGGGLVSMTAKEMNAARKGAWKRSVKEIVPETLKALKASPGFKRAAGGFPLVKTAYAKFGKRLIGGRGAGRALPPPSALAPDSREIFLIPDIMVGYFANTSEFSIDKAREKLGYTPAFSVERGMDLTEQWARWAGLVPG